MPELSRENWAQLHHQLGLPSLLPLYFFIINVIVDVLMENLKLYHKPHMDNETIEIDSVSRQQVIKRMLFTSRIIFTSHSISVSSGSKISSQVRHQSFLWCLINIHLILEMH